VRDPRRNLGSSRPGLRSSRRPSAMARVFAGHSTPFRSEERRSSGSVAAAARKTSRYQTKFAASVAQSRQVCWLGRTVRGGARSARDDTRR
ncbi:unnamed protein product, partial [Polarella glacialis]